MWDPAAPSLGRDPAITQIFTPPRPGDVGDYIDPNAPDPTPDEIVDPEHPDHVQPWIAG